MDLILRNLLHFQFLILGSQFLLAARSTVIKPKTCPLRGQHPSLTISYCKIQTAAYGESEMYARPCVLQHLFRAPLLLFRIQLLFSQTGFSNSSEILHGLLSFILGHSLHIALWYIELDRRQKSEPNVEIKLGECN